MRPLTRSHASYIVHRHRYSSTALVRTVWQGPIIGQFVELAVAALEGNNNPVCLDIASGPGEPGFSIAAAVPNATVTATDLAEGMVQAAHSRARKLGLSNVK